MPSAGTANSLKFRAGIKIARRMAARTHTGRVASATMVGARATLRSLTHAFHIFFLQTTALFFSVFAVIGGAAAVREYVKYTAGQATIGKFVLGAAFSAMFGYFAISSFARAYRKAKRAS